MTIPDNIEIFSESRAYPTIGVILLGGISDKNSRIPLHTSAGIAYTGINDDIHVNTKLFVDSEKRGFLNGEPLSIEDNNRSPFAIIDRYYGSIKKKLGTKLEGKSISFISENTGILSGSSDGAAAAMGRCIESLSGDTIDWAKFENELRVISESVGRSVYGGLTITRKNGDLPTTERILDKEKFRDYYVVGCKFHSTRNPSDVIHENVKNSPDYGKRIETTAQKGKILEKLAEDSDIKGIFELGQEDTDEYHKLIESVGVEVITPQMRKFIDHLKVLQKDFWSSYIVTGGSNVFVAVDRKNYERIVEEAKTFDSEPVILKVAGEASVINKAGF